LAKGLAGAVTGVAAGGVASGVASRLAEAESDMANRRAAGGGRAEPVKVETRDYRPWRLMHSGCEARGEIALRGRLTSP